MSKPVNFSYSNNLSSTRQPIVNNKEANTNNGMPASSSGVISGMSRPNVNLGHAPQTDYIENYNNAKNYIGPFAKAYPIKHWRRQLSMNNSRGRTATSISVVERPGGTVFRGYTNNNCKCDENNNNLFVTFDNKFLQSTSQTIKPPATIMESSGTVNNKLQNNGYIQIGNENDHDSYQIQTGVYNTKNICYTPENK